MNLNFFLNRGIGNITKTLGRYYLEDRKGRAFLSRLLPRIRQCAEIRGGYERAGTHIPPFLIASVASQCNLRCAGCYAQAGGACGEAAAPSDLSGESWRAVFDQAAELGVPFVLLAGGEPFLRRDVIEAAAASRDVVFPVFTNGTVLDAAYFDLLDENRNVVPVISIEGDVARTDGRRGDGVSRAVEEAMERLREKGILFGISITVTRENLREVTQADFLAGLRGRGCGLVFFVEYVPVSAGTQNLALQPGEIEELAQAVAGLKRSVRDMILLSFPGDEAAMGGCLASGRGFFHINAAGGAEPCPFSPYSRHNVQSSSLLEILRSDFFAGAREIAGSAGEYTGGCTLFALRDRVEALQTR